MSDLQRPAPRAGAQQTPPEDLGDLTPMTAALLEFSSDDLAETGPRAEPGLRYLTSKEAYFWAAVAVALAEAGSQYASDASIPDTPGRIETIHVVKALSSAFQAQADAIRQHYTSVPDFRIDGIEQGGSSVRKVQPNLDSVLARLVLGFIAAIRPEARIEAFHINNALDEVKEAVEDLERRDFIVDPILEVGLGAAVLGLVPVSFTHKTKNGKLAHLKLQAALWKYERKRVRDEVETNVTFEAARLAKILKGKVVELFHEVVGGRREPPEPPDQARA